MIPTTSSGGQTAREPKEEDDKRQLDRDLTEVRVRPLFLLIGETLLGTMQLQLFGHLSHRQLVNIAFVSRR